MKLTTIALFIIALSLSACEAGVGQVSTPQSQIASPRSTQPVNLPFRRSLASYPTRNLGGDFSLDSTRNLWDGFSDYPARSLWGGFPLLLTAKATTTSSSSPPSSSDSQSFFPSSCVSPEDFCVFQHYFPFQRPFSSDFNTAIEPSYLYGTTEFGALEPHHGVEILNPTGTPVLAAADGTVVVAENDAHSVYGPWENFYGNLVVLEHSLPGMDEPVYTLYGHLSKITVGVGQGVKAGEIIGEVGATGRAIGSHLHFEVRVGTNQYTSTRNPALWLSPRTNENGQQYGTLAGKLDNARGNPIDFTFKAEYYPDNNGSPQKTYYIETYATDIDPIRGDDTYQENFVLVDLPPGRYRIALSVSGKWTERWVDVEAGKLSFVTIVSK